MARGALTLADVKNSFPATRALLAGAISTATVLEEPTRNSTAHAAADEAILLLDEVRALLGDILDTLSPEELRRLPEPIWALLDFIAGSEATEARAL
jgi:hypothetical protein